MVCSDHEWSPLDMALFEEQERQRKLAGDKTKRKVEVTGRRGGGRKRVVEMCYVSACSRRQTDKKLKRFVLSRDPLYPPPPKKKLAFSVPIMIVIVCLLLYPVLRYAGLGWVWGVGSTSSRKLRHSRPCSLVKRKQPSLKRSEPLCATSAKATWMIPTLCRVAL